MINDILKNLDLTFIKKLDINNETISKIENINKNIILLNNNIESIKNIEEILYTQFTNKMYIEFYKENYFLDIENILNNFISKNTEYTNNSYYLNYESFINDINTLNKDLQNINKFLNNN